MIKVILKGSIILMFGSFSILASLSNNEIKDEIDTIDGVTVV